MSYLTQMLALTVQNFLSAAIGIAVVVALVRGFACSSTPRGQTRSRPASMPRNTIVMDGRVEASIAQSHGRACLPAVFA